MSFTSFLRSLCAFSARALCVAISVGNLSTLVDIRAVAAEASVGGKLPTLEQTSREFYGSERARKTLMNFPTRGERTDRSIPPRLPEETIASFKLMGGLEAEVVLNEPVVRQPVFLNFDERGRMWVVQFLQYPYPAGVKIIDFDDQFHAVYDKVPPPPPHHDRGVDKITIHEDCDGDGIFETHKVFLDGLNMVTAVERGRGGVWVLNPPYLVFWPDRNNDDVPDGDPVVHLAGFGLEDTHSAANSLRWGPDGWLYGVQGSGVTATIRRPGLDDGDGFRFKGQVVWRYQPDQRTFELFSEGGGNSFALEFDAAGRAWSGINGSNHRGFHFVQGGYYSKNFGEHGFFTNPYTFGWFDPLTHDRESLRFSHTFVIYEAGALGPRFDGRLIAPVPLQNQIVLSELLPRGSTYATRDLGHFLDSSDRWFRPVDIKVGPDGAVYVADWYDTRLSHMDPRDTWDRAHGRIYRIRATGARDSDRETGNQGRNPPASAGAGRFDLAKWTGSELIEALSHTNKWFRQTALRLLGDRRDASLIPKLATRSAAADNPFALDALWALHAAGGFEAEVAETLLSHAQSSVRAWTVRLIGEIWGSRQAGLGGATPPSLPPRLTEGLMTLANRDEDPQVRSQLASTARRLPGSAAIPLIFALAHRDADASDPHIPLLLWWALEAHALSHRSDVLATLPGRSPGASLSPSTLSKTELSASRWSQPLIRQHLLPRLARLYATLPTAENQETLASLLRSAPDTESRKAVISGINEALKGRGADSWVASLEQALDQARPTGPRDPAQLSLAIRRSDGRALREALAFISNETALREDRLGVIEALGETRQQIAVPAFLELLARSPQAQVRQSAVAALGRFDSNDIADEILARWSQFDASLKRSALTVLCSRKSWAHRLLRAAGGSGTISKADVPDEIALRIRLFRDRELDALCDRYFGKPLVASSEAKQRRIGEFAGIVRDGPKGNLRDGKAIFTSRCAACHTLFGEGANIGPDLTGSERTNLDNMLLNIVDPSVAIREGFTLFQIRTKDDRELTGYIAERGAGRIVLRDPSGQSMVIRSNDIAQEQALTTSLMPEGLLDDLVPQQVRDLFAFLSGVGQP